MAEWKSNVRFNQPCEDGTIFTLKGQEGISIHKIVGLGDSLYLTCNDLNIVQFGLNTEDFDTAVENAKTIVRTRLETLQEKFNGFLSDETETKFVRY